MHHFQSSENPVQVTTSAMNPRLCNLHSDPVPLVNLEFCSSLLGLDPFLVHGVTSCP